MQKWSRLQWEYMPWVLCHELYYKGGEKIEREREEIKLQEYWSQNDK